MWPTGRDRTLTARVRVVAEAGQGSQISVLNDAGSPLLSGFKPAAVSSRMADTEVWSLLERNYQLTGWRGAQVAGRPATMVEADPRFRSSRAGGGSTTGAG